ncbi:MAG: hypothetical protein Q8K89_02015, partial [Actinomycetota bacterium]|nr:hypothetical protein [Actinomycetota bacterium]
MRKIIALAVLFCAVFGWAEPAAALHLIRQARAVTVNQAQILTDGVNADMYIYAKPAGLDQDKVCSIYGGLDNGDFLETGYFWSPAHGPSSPMCFNHRYISSTDTHAETEWWGGYTPGTYVDWSLEKSPGTTTWRVIVSGALKGTWT